MLGPVARSSQCTRRVWRCSSVVTQRCTLRTKVVMDADHEPCPVEPWPYKQIGYTYWKSFFDGTTKRISDRSRIIIVEGNIACGKSEVARQIAEAFDMHYIPEFSTDMILVNSYGNDLRDYTHLVPYCFRTPDRKQFFAEAGRTLKESEIVNSIGHMLYGRHEQMFNAYAHMLNTGQGVVVERSVFSDFVFVNALRSKRLVTDSMFRHYHYFRRSVIRTFRELYPHLCIYLDTPVDACLQNIKRRANPGEVDSAILDGDYLRVVEDSYRDMLTEIERHAKLLIYDWPNLAGKEGVDRIVEDIENTDLDFFEYHSMSQMMKWWLMRDDWDWSSHRINFTEKFAQLFYIWSSWHTPDVAGMASTLDDRDQYEAVLKHCMFPEGRAYGYTGPFWERDWFRILTRARHDWPDHIMPWYEHLYKDAYFALWHPSPRTHFTGGRTDPPIPDYVSAHH